ncbi:MAG: GumK N-terminal domain-containing glycosyltransferase, partial [Kiritimatiellia bacterium]
MPRILMACSIYWTSALRVGSHHIAKTLVRKGWEVGFISYPISPWHMLRKTETDFRARLALHRSGGSRFLNGRLWAYVPFAPLVPANVPFLRSAWIHHNWLRLSIPNLVRILRSNGFSSVDALYIDSPAMARLLSPTLEYRKSVYRLADRTDAFDFAVPAFLEMERELAAAVDVVAYTAETLQSYAAALGPRRMAHLPNAVDLETFTGATAPLPPEYAGLARPIAVYAGAMHHWFDFDLVNKVTELLPEISFVFIGPDTLARTRLFLRPNVHVLGPRPQGRLPEYLANADIALIPFETRRFAELVGSVNPLKLY